MSTVAAGRRVRLIRYRAAAARMFSIEAIRDAGYGFLGSCLSVADIMAALSVILGVGIPGNRNQIILSKGHAAPILYSLLDGPMHAGLYASLGTTLQSHPRKGTLPGIGATSGSLGLAPGYALGRELADRDCGGGGILSIVVGDGELQAGILQEFLAYVALNEVPGILVVVDANGEQSVRSSSNRLLKNSAGLFRDHVEISGHDIPAMVENFSTMSRLSPPRLVVARTTRDRGIVRNVIPEGSPMSFVPSASVCESSIRALKRELDLCNW